MARAILWDLDGTLVDTAEYHFLAWQWLLAELGHDFTRPEFATTFGRRNPEIFQYLFPDRFSAREVSEYSLSKEEYYRSMARDQGVTLLPGALKLIDAAAGNGWRQAIGSSAPRANIELILDLTQSRRFFSALVSGDDTDRGKPDPQVFQRAARGLDVQPRDCVVMEDAPSGVEAARAAGMRCVAVRFVGHHPAERLEQAGADLVVACLSEVRLDDLARLLAEERRP